MKKLYIIWYILLAGSMSFSQKPDNKAEIIKNFTVYEESGRYLAWPAIVQADNGDLIVSFCRADEHVSPTGEIVYTKSTDKGNTWIKPSVLYNTPIDDRGVSLTKLKDGRILAGIESVFHNITLFTETFAKSNAYPTSELNRWAEYMKTNQYTSSKKLGGSYFLLSADNGNTWSKPFAGKPSFREGIQINDTTLLLSYYGTNNKILLYTVNIAKIPWVFTSDTLNAPDMKSYSFAEPQMLNLNSGRIIMFIRTTANNPYDDENYKNLLWETYSDDNGKTWAEMYPLPLWGFPAHLLQMKDGRIVAVYGYRRNPYGIRACLSEDGITWKHENEIIIRDDGPNKDLGYPVSVEIAPGKILTVYYQPDLPKGTKQDLKPPQPDRKKPGILGTVWKVPPRIKH